MSDTDRFQTAGLANTRAMLLEAGRLDSPPVGAPARALAALGAGALATSATGIAGATTSATRIAGAATNLAAQVAPITKLVLVAKWVGLGAGAALLTVGAAPRWLAQPARTPSAHGAGSGVSGASGPARSARFAPSRTPPSPEPVVEVATASTGACPAVVPSPGAQNVAPAAPGMRRDSTAMRAAFAAPLPSSSLADLPTVARADRVPPIAGDTGHHVSAPDDDARHTSATATAVASAFEGLESEANRMGATAAVARAKRLLAQEIAVLDAARQQLASGSAIQALATLDSYFKEFPRGELGPEATLLCIEALLRAGRRTAAEQLAHQFLRDHPSTQHRQRLDGWFRAGTLEPQSIP